MIVLSPQTPHTPHRIPYCEKQSVDDAIRTIANYYSSANFLQKIGTPVGCCSPLKA